MGDDTTSEQNAKTISWVRGHLSDLIMGLLGTLITFMAAWVWDINEDRAILILRVDGADQQSVVLKEEIKELREKLEEQQAASNDIKISISSINTDLPNIKRQVGEVKDGVDYLIRKSRGQ